MKITYGRHSISDEDIKRVVEVLRGDFLTTGPFVGDFEKAFAKYVDAKYAVAVANGTAALHLAAKTVGVNDKSQVITTPMSFAATANCVRYNGGTPIFSDITERGLLDPQEICSEICNETQGIIPMHHSGLPCDMKEISKIAKENDLFVIEDACHALGARYNDKPIGHCEFSDLAVFSLHPVKHITTGEGGIITTNDEEMYSALKTLRTHGITKDKSKFKTNHNEPWFQEMQQLGFNYRLTDIQAALGLSQLLRVKEFVKRRREIAKEYDDFFENLSDHVDIISEHENEFHSYHLYVIKLKDESKRRELFEYLSSKGIYCQVHYIPIYWHPYYRETGFNEIYLPKTEDFYKRIISIPMYPELSSNELQFVMSSLKAFF
jgi:UDP-4-amino-4,6-dideoxy-N-acetyl-beta-L-altrosamine transaminase